MVEFNPKWYKKLINSTNEKDFLVSKIADILQGKPHNSCLEIGLGIYPFFAENLSPKFKRYVIVEREKTENPVPKAANLLKGNWLKSVKSSGLILSKT